LLGHGVRQFLGFIMQSDRKSVLINVTEDVQQIIEFLGLTRHIKTPASCLSPRDLVPIVIPVFSLYTYHVYQKATSAVRLSIFKFNPAVPEWAGVSVFDVQFKRIRGFKGSSVAESHDLMAFLDGAKASLRAPHSRE